MRNRHSRTKCIKKKLSKCEGTFRAYSPIQFVYGEKLQTDDSVESFICNYPLVDFTFEGDYSTDFLITKTDGDIIVRECIFRKHLLKPLSIKQLDASRIYWLKRGVEDWGLVIDARK